MLCWGSWANTLKLCPGYRFQLFYWDYALGLAGGTVFWGLTAGSHGHSGTPFLADIVQAPVASILFAAIGGVVFNIANLLLVAAIEVAGLAVAFPVGIGLALIVGAVSSYLVRPLGNPLLLFGGVALVTIAILFDASAYRLREAKSKSKEKVAPTRGIVLSLVAGVLMGTFYPLVAAALRGAKGVPPVGPYAVALFFAGGVLLSTIPANLFLMWKPLDGKPPVKLSGYMPAPITWHLAGLLGGAIWATGAIANFVASGANLVGPAVSYSIGQGATKVSACWGVFVWREFADAPKAANRALIYMFLFFALGLVAVALAPLY
jgi:glucose uptake protein